MPDDPIEGDPIPGKDPTDKLRELFDRIEKEESPNRTGHPEVPSNDELRAGAHMSPIESQINGDHLGPEKGSDEDELSEEEKQLRAFDERLKAARSGAMPEPPDWNFQRPKIPGQNKVEENNYFGMGVGISIAYTLVGATLVGWGIGKLIDMRFGGSMGQAIGTLIGAVVGLGAAIVTIIKAQNKPGH